MLLLLRIGVIISLCAYPRQLGNEALAPPSAGVLEDIAFKLAIVGLALVGAHGNRVVDRVGKLLRVPRVDDQTSVQTLSCASELGQNHDAMILALRGNILIRDEVHAITGGADQADIADSVESSELIERDGLVEEVDGHELDSAEFAVDTADKLVNNGA